MTRARSPARLQRGFTVMELVIAIVIMGILSVVGVSMISDTFTTARVVNARESSANDARYALERLAREIREVKFIDKATGYAITTMAGTNMVFTKDVGGADVVVTITQTGSDLTLGYSSPAAISAVAKQVSAFSLQFLKVDSTSATASTSATTLPTDVRFVVISLTVTDSTSGKQVTERTRVALRNM
jgi:prepilin-type N-terminal cleavage/methylation domain-containing protein